MLVPPTTTTTHHHHPPSPLATVSRPVVQGGKPRGTQRGLMAVGGPRSARQAKAEEAVVEEEQKPPTVKQAFVHGAQQHPPVHHSQAEAALSEEAEAAPPKFFKPALRCGTPGCDLINFHQGPHTCQQVVGPRQRRRSVRAHADAEGPAVAAKSVRKKRAAPPEEMEMHETLSETECPTAAVARPVASADLVHSLRDRLAAPPPPPPPDPRRTDFLVRLFVFGHT